MNKLLPYEIEIAKKIYQAPIPDIQDAVWSKIQNLLEADVLPDVEGEASKILRKTSWKIAAAVAITIVLVILFIISKIQKSRQEKEVQQTVMPVKAAEVGKQKIDSQSQPAILPSLKPFNKNISDTSTKNNALINDTLIDLPQPQKNTNTPFLIIPDSITARPKEQFQVLNKDTVNRKPRGVSGISDSDYRFTMPKKDST
jgi:hypothetical protein